MEKIIKLRNDIKEFSESYYFLFFICGISLFTFFIEYKIPFFFVFAAILLVLVLCGSSLKSMIPLLVYYFNLHEHNQMQIPSATYFICLGVYAIVFGILIYQIVIHFKEYFVRLKKDWLLYSMFLILAMMLLSFINSEDFGLSAIGLGNFAVTILAYALVRMTVEPTEENKNYIITSIILTAVVISIECIFMFFYRLSQGFNYWDIFNRKLLSFNAFNSNHYTAFINVAFVLCIYFFCKFKEIWKRILLIVFITLFLIVNVFTMCRAGILALGITAILAIVVYFIYNKKVQKNKIWKDSFYLIPFVVGMIVCIVFLYRTGALQEILDRLKNIGFSENGRNEVYEAAIEQFKLHPIIGSGVYTTHLYVEWWNYHNYVLQMLGTCGILGLLAFITYMVFSVKRTWHFDMYSIFVGIVIIYFLIHGIFDTMYFHNILMPLVVVLQAVQEDPIRKKRETASKAAVEETI